MYFLWQNIFFLIIRSLPKKIFEILFCGLLKQCAERRRDISNNFLLLFHIFSIENPEETYTLEDICKI